MDTSEINNSEYAIGVDVGTGSARADPAAEVIKPNRATHKFHNSKHEIFKLMYDHQQEYKRIIYGN